MRKSITVLLCAFLMLIGCSNNQVEEEATTGGWGYSNSLEEVNIPEDAKEAFEKANDGSYKLVAYLGSQVVAGTNYYYLCEKKNTLYNVVVYNDLEGNSSILKSNVVNIENKDIDFEEQVGALDPDEATGYLSTEQKAVFEKAIQTKTDDITYTPITCLGTQIVAGTNYRFLCKATQTNKQPVTKLAIIEIYEDLKGQVEITSICEYSPIFPASLFSKCILICLKTDSNSVQVKINILTNSNEYTFS